MRADLDVLVLVLLYAFWMCAAWLGYVYWAYGALLALAASGLGKRPLRPETGQTHPSVTILLTVHDEASNIERRLRNLFEQDYPPSRVEILVASDGSTDATNDIVRGYAGRVRLLPTARLGKSGAQNLAVREAQGDIVVLTDAEASFDPGCVRALVAPFADPSVGCTTAHLRFLDRSDNITRSQGLYWRYELKVRRLESELGILAVASGQAMAFRRRLFRELPTFVGDDCLIPLHVREQRYRVVQCEDALAYDFMEHEDGREFRSRVRMTLRNWVGTWMTPALLNPLRHPGIAFGLWSHKLLRWLGAVALLVMVVAALVMAALRVEPVIAVGFGLFLAAGLAGFAASRASRTLPIAGSIYSFLLANAGFLGGLAKAMRGQRIVAYRRDRSAGESRS
jgi:glycosyltransferase involved in cell wall biosynthesis